MIDKKEVSKAALKHVPFLLGMDYLGALASNTLPVFKDGIKDLQHLELYKDRMLEYVIHPTMNLSHAFHNEYFLKGQLLLLAFGGYLTLKDAWGKRNKFEFDSKYGSHGTSSWATKDEAFDKNFASSSYDSGGFFIGRYGRKPLYHKKGTMLNRHSISFGSPGSGKSSAVIIPQIVSVVREAMINSENADSLILTDVKGELYEKTSGMLREAGYDVKVVNFEDMKLSVCYNPLDYIEEDEDVREIAESLVLNAAQGKTGNDNFWFDAQVSMLSFLIHAIRYTLPKEEQHLANVFQLLNMEQDKMKQIAEKFPPYHIVNISYRQAIQSLQDKTAANVFISLKTTMGLWVYQRVCEFTYTSDFRFEDISEQPTALFVIIPAGEMRYRTIISTMFTQMFSVLYREAGRNMGRLKRPCRFLLDEYCNLGRFAPGFESRLATCRSMLIEMHMICQSLGQLQNRYGRERAEEIMGCCDITMLLSCRTKESADYFMGMLDDTTIRTHSQSKTGDKHSESENRTRRPLMTRSELLNMDRKYMLVFVSGKNPMKLKKGFWEGIKEFSELMTDPSSRYDYKPPERKAYVPYDWSAIFPDQAEAKETEATNEIRELETEQSLDEFFVS